MVLIKVIDGDSWIRIDNLMSTDDFLLQARGGADVELSSDSTATKGMLLKNGQSTKILVSNIVYARARGESAVLYMDDVLVSGESLVIDTSVLAKESKQDTIITNIGTTNTTLANILTDVGTIDASVADIKSNSDDLVTDTGTIKTTLADVKTGIDKLDPTLTWTAVTALNTNVTAVTPVKYATKNNVMYLDGAIKFNDDRVNVIGANTEIKFFTTTTVPSAHTFMLDNPNKLLTLNTDGSVSDLNFLQYFEKDEVVSFEGVKFYIN